jgi:hypothetical protein
MSLLDPFAGLSQLRKVPQFFRELRGDLRFLLTPDISPDITLPPRSTFADDGTYHTAIQEWGRCQKFAAVRQAAQKQVIRESLWPRFCVCFCLAAPVAFPLGMLIEIMRVACLLSNNR